MIELTSSDWVDVYQAEGIALGSRILVQNQGVGGVVALKASATPPDAGAAGLLLGPSYSDQGIFFDPKGTTLRLYARAAAGDSSLFVMDAGVLSPNGQRIAEFGQYRQNALGETARLKTENLSIAQQYIVDGLGFYFQWTTPSVPAGQSVWLEFTVPAGKYLALENREIITDKERAFYRTYTSADYSGFVPATGIPARNLRSDALAQTVPNIAYAGTIAIPPAASLALNVIPVFGAEGVGGRSSGDLASDNIFRLLAPGSRFLLEVANASTAAMYAQVDLDFALIPAAMVQAALA